MTDENPLPLTHEAAPPAEPAEDTPHRGPLQGYERKHIWDACGVLLRAANSPILDDLDLMITEANRAEAIGPLLQPTEWIGEGAVDTHRFIKSVLEACGDFRRATADLEARRKELAAEQAERAEQARS